MKDEIINYYGVIKPQAIRKIHKNATLIDMVVAMH